MYRNKTQFTERFDKEQRQAILDYILELLDEIEDITIDEENDDYETDEDVEDNNFTEPKAVRKSFRWTMTASGNEGIPGVHIYIYVRLKNSDKSLNETLEDSTIRSALIEKLKEAVTQSDVADRIVFKDGKGWDLESSVEVTEMRQNDGTQPITEFAIEIIDERISDEGKAV